jgi:hypothetical protein
MLKGAFNATGSTVPTSGLCAQVAKNSSGLYCYTPDTTQRTCTKSSSTTALSMCTAAGPELAFSEPIVCCNKLAQLGIIRQEMQGPCRPAAAEAPACFTPNLAAGACDTVAEPNLCHKLWASQGQFTTRGKAQVFDTLLSCCNSVAASVGFAKTSGTCSAAMVRVALPQLTKAWSSHGLCNSLSPCT